MRVTHCGPAHEDARGSIVDIVQGENYEHVTLITSRTGTRRGDHYHKRTHQAVFVVTGSMLAYAQLPDGPVEAVQIEAGDLIENAPGEMHALVALEDSTFLVLTRGPRGGDAFEEDTFRLKEPLR